MFKVAILAPYQIYPATTGGQRCITLLYKYCATLFNVTIITTKNNAINKDGIEVEKLLGTSKFRYINPILFFTIRRFLIQQKFTHLILEHPYFGWLGYAIKKTTNIKLIIHSHNIEGLRFKSTNKKWWKILWHYEKWVHRQAHKNFFITNADKQYAVEHWGLKPNLCHIITYGTELQKIPTADQKITASNYIKQQHNIPQQNNILLFNGQLDYAPNVHAVYNIINHINPILKRLQYPYTIIICGKNLPTAAINLIDNKTIIYAGFVADISTYFTGADVFINPVVDGGGIKTKLVEALAYNATAVSTINGAIGVNNNLLNGKLTLAPNNNWEEFCKQIIEVKKDIDTPKIFFEEFYWGNIARKVEGVIKKIKL